MYHTMPILSRCFAKKVFRKNFGKSVDKAETAVYNEHRQAENGQTPTGGGKNRRRKEKRS